MIAITDSMVGVVNNGVREAYMPILMVALIALGAFGLIGLLLVLAVSLERKKLNSSETTHSTAA